MEHQSFSSYDTSLEDLPFPIPQDLYGCALVSPNFRDTLANIEQFMVLKEYRTAAALLTIAMQRFRNLDSSQVVNLLCKRAECLLLMNYVQLVIRDCQAARLMTGRLNEHMAFLLFRCFEMQGEIEEAFGYAIIYRALDPQMKRDKHAVHRLRNLVIWLCGQGCYQIDRTINILILRGQILFENKETDLALKIYTEVLELFPGVVEAHEYRARCYLLEGHLLQANQDCNRALNLSQRRSKTAFDTKIKIKVQHEKFEEALELLDEWRIIDSENPVLDNLEMDITSKLRKRQGSRAISKSQSLSDLSLAGNESCDPDETPIKQRVKRSPIRASKQCSGAKPKSKRELKQEEWKRGKEREQIAQDMEKIQKEKENRLNKEKADGLKGEKQHATSKKSAGNRDLKMEGTLVTEPSITARPPPLPLEPRTRKRRVRRKTRNLRAHREGNDDDSDASSVCSINTCPGDLGFRSNTQHRPKMPTFWDTDQGAVTDQPKSSSRQNQPPKPQMKILNKQIRPRPSGIFGRYLICRYIELQKPCFKGKRCTFAHSEKERVAWEEDRKKVASKPTVREEKIRKPQTKESSSSPKEGRLAFKGKCRAPLRKPVKGGKYEMCPEWVKGTCKLGNKCTFAHGDKEHSEWNAHLLRTEKEMEQKREEENKDDNSAATIKSNSFIRRNLQAPTYEVKNLVSNLLGVTVTCQPEDLNVKLQLPLDFEREISYNWTVRVCYESSETGHLQHVVLFPQYHKCYSLSSVRFRCDVGSPHGVKTSVQSPDNEELADDMHYQVEPYLRTLNGSCEVDILITFSTRVFGSFGQILVLDFGKESHLTTKMNIEVGSQGFMQEFGKEKSQLTLDGEAWDDSSRKIFKFEPKSPSVFRNEHLIDKYQLPSAEQIVPSPLLDSSQGLSQGSYVNVMHQLLFVEEVYIRKQIASFNMKEVSLHAAKLVVKKYEVLCAQEQWLYGLVKMERSITPDDAQGRLLLRNLFSGVGSVLIAKSHTDSMVYEALVDSVEDNRVILKLSEKCCKDLALSNNAFMTVDVQFQINRLPLCEMHENIDRLGPEHFRILFPELGVYSHEKIQQLPWILYQDLNEDQREIINKIAAPAIDSPPLVVFGPFGTGKTFTLNQAIRRISVNQNSRVLLCTHSNSAADLHVKLLDTYLEKENGIVACKPLRIYTPLRKLSTVPETVKAYCLIDDRGQPTERFRLPTREEVIAHRVIVSTLSMSRALFNMDLHRFFSHILIDEAAQALEAETITPLTLAGNNTKVVFTGDHMQMSPDVFSPQAKKWGFHISLQERLFYDYKRRQKEATLDPNLILLTENYRSNERVLQFPSDMFYGGQLTSGSRQPLHPRLGPLVFYAALGKEEIDESNASFRNLAEVNEIVRRVKELNDSWPEEEWGAKNLNQIAVVSSYRYQVKTIRDALRKVGFGGIDVETVDNVQGKQFRALFVSTVRTVHTSKKSSNSEGCGEESPYLYFLSDPKLLNTALTRAQSLIAVVGDPFSLRTIGNCQGLWEEFIKRCSDDGKLFGIEHDELEESISQTGLNVNAAEFVPTVATVSNKQVPTDPSDPLSDESLQESYVDDYLKKGNSTISAYEKSNLSKVLDSNNDTTNPISDEVNPSNMEDNEYDASDSNDASDEMSENDDLSNADDFAVDEKVDETVPPRYMDPIIQALKKTCEEKLLRKRERTDEKGEFNGNLKQDREGVNCDGHQENKNVVIKGISESTIVHEDIKMKTKKGKIQMFLVNLNYGYSERTKRLIHQDKPNMGDQECLQSEYLDLLLKDDPKLYTECTLRVNCDGYRRTYGEIRDVESEDILIEGNTRQSFDRDTAVVKLADKTSDDSNKHGGLKGNICGIRHHAINLRERQFVCTISRENPRLMFPINKSMTPIANLTDESIRGVPIYKRVQSGEKAVRVDALPLEEALSGKYLFVVQYLQWRPEFPYPLGIVTKKFRKGVDITDAFKLLNAEYQLKEYFPEDITREIERESQTRSWSTIPGCERTSRQVILNAFTIDPPGSRALDDALTLEELENGLFKVGVHITDVSFFVQEGSKIDMEAKKRATSYFRGHGSREVPMLPEELSHNICSLLPNQDRRAVSVFITFDQDGRIQEEDEFDFCRTIVRSQCRLTYPQAQKVILGKTFRCRSEDGQMTSEIETNIRLLSYLAQKRRQQRLCDQSYFHFDHSDRKEDFEAHELVEEMMILTNTLVAKYLVQKKPALLPLRIQLPPKTNKLNEWREKFGSCARLSLSLRRHLPTPEDVGFMESIVIPISTWKSICNARRQSDQGRELKLLLCNDNIFPQLAIANSSLNNLRRKAEDLRAAKVNEEFRVHWSLKVREYTRFTSPIRRYLDVVVHRLLLDTLREDVREDELEEIFRQCSCLSEKSSKFERECGKIQLAGKLRLESCEVSATVETIERDFIRLHLLSDANQYLSAKQREIKISHLGPAEQPMLDESSKTLELKWTLRIYDASSKNIKRAKIISMEAQEKHLRQDTKKILASLSQNLFTSSGYCIPGNLWLEIIEAVKDDDDSRLQERLRQIDQVIAQREEQNTTENEIADYYEYSEEDDIGGDDDTGAVVDDDNDDDYGDGDSDDNDNDKHEDEDDDENDYDDEDEEHDEDDEDEDDDDDYDHASDEEDNLKKRREEMINTTKGKNKIADANENDLHFIKTTLELQIAGSVSVQLSANTTGALISPEIQCFKLAPDFHICLEHRRRSDECFAKVASREASQKRYRTINSYVYAWNPVLAMEAATDSVKNDDTFILQNLEVTWKIDERGRSWVGKFKLAEKFCRTRNIEIFGGDYACVRIPFVRSSYSKNESSASDGSHSEYETASEGEDFEESSSLDRVATKSCWVGHCSLKCHSEKATYSLKLFKHSMEFSNILKRGKTLICNVEIIKQSVPFRRMISTLNDLPKNAAALTKNICLGRAPRLEALRIQLPRQNISIIHRPLNNLQEQAVRKSLREQFTVIQGPPGTGKTVTGVHIAYWFAHLNFGDGLEDTSKDKIPEKAPRQVFYCGPSNKSVDVVAEYLKEKGIKILRVYGDVIEEEEYPIPNKIRRIRQTTVHQVPDSLKDISLHHVIRDKLRSPKAPELKKYEKRFARMKRAKKKVKDEEVAEYLKVKMDAEKWVIRSVRKKDYYQIVLCTCSVAGSKRIRKACNNTLQCIVDECAMCLEPETIVPIHWSEAKQVVLIGDHMQLQPIVTNRVAKSLGLNKSLFERYSDCALMLEEQFRMHEDICEFPSEHFYHGKLRTADSVMEREEEVIVSKDFWPNHSEKGYVPLVFCHVVGEEGELVVTTEEGHEKSKRNVEEKDKVVEVIKKLQSCGRQKGDGNQILVLSPYRAQCHIIQEDLNANKIAGVTVTSIVKSQGSEEDFVIISLVRSLPDSQIEHEPSRGWLREKLGFVTDEHQINVALTRAKRGLCIIGNKNLLEVCEMWNCLIDHYREKQCFVDGRHWP